GRRAHRELVHVRLAERDEARLARLLDDRRVVGRHVALEDLRTRGRRHVGRDEHVLDRERYARELGQLLAGTAALVDAARDVDRRVVNVEEGVHIAVDRGLALGVRLGRLAARALARGERCGQLGRRELREIGHPCSAPRIAVTRKRVPSLSGALRSASSVVSMSPGMSSRNTFSRGIGWLVAGTSEVATSLTCAMLATMASSSPVRLVTSSSDSWIRASTPRWRTRSGVMSDTPPVYASEARGSGQRSAPSSPAMCSSLGLPHRSHGGGACSPYGPTCAGPA